MPSARRKILEPMTVADFLAWEGDGSGRKFQLVDGELRAMSPAQCGLMEAIQPNWYRLSGNWLEKQVVHAGSSPSRPWPHGFAPTSISAFPTRRELAHLMRPSEQALPDPIVLIEILSPGNASSTWDNVWSYTTIPSVREILVVHSTRRFAELLRRDADGNWPAEPEEIDADGTLRLDSIAFACPLPAVYAQTHLA